MRKIFFYLLLFFCCLPKLYAQDDTAYSTNPQVIVQAPVEETDEDADAVENKGFAPQSHGDTLLDFRTMRDAGDTVAKWKTKPEFAYMQRLDSILQSLQEQKQTAKKNTIKATPPSPGILSSGLFQMLMWGLAIFFIGFILYNLFLSKGFFKAASAKKSTAQPEPGEEENIAGSDYEKLLRQSYLLGDMRMAGRYLFLKTLQKLNEKELIVFAADKTNSDYLYEIPEAKRTEFSSLALYYEYIWYGNMALAKDDFDKIEIRFNKFLNRL